MKVWGIWFGGHGSYSEPEIPRDVEVFTSMVEADYSFRSRYQSDGKWAVYFRWAWRSTERTYTPAVGNDSWLKLFLADPSDERDPIPDWVITFGPRGGMQRKRP